MFSKKLSLSRTYDIGSKTISSQVDNAVSQKEKINIPKRYILAFLGFFCFVNLFAMQMNLSIAIVAMVKFNISNATGPEYTVSCQDVLPNHTYSNKSESEHKKQGEFEWDSRMQSLVLGSYYYGYVLTQIPGGFLSVKYDAKWVIGIGILTVSVLSLLTPVAARWSVWALVLVRVIEGLASGVLFPSMNTLIARWSPIMERSRISSIIFTGSDVGIAVSMIISGILCDLTFLGGWPLAFYVFGMSGCVWFVFWIALVDKSPQTHPSISKEELLYIKQGQEEDQLQIVPIPWKSMLTSLPLWAVIIGFISSDWGAYTLFTELPTYLHNIFHVDAAQNGVMSALPPLVSCIFTLLSAALADKLRARGCLSITTIRKIFTFIGTFIPAICFLIISYIGCRPSLIIALFTIALGSAGVLLSGCLISHVDMSPTHAGILYGITNTLGSMCGFLVPSYVGWIIHDQNTVDNWRKVFVTGGVVCIVSGTIYILFGSAELQTWDKVARPQPAEKKDVEMKKKSPSKSSSNL